MIAESQPITHPNKDKPKEKPISRQQRRLIERKEQEAKNTHELLCQSFLDFFIEHEQPESEEVVNKWKSISAKWKVYCTAKNLNKPAYNLIDTFCQGLINKYKEENTTVKSYDKDSANQAQG